MTLSCAINFINHSGRTFYSGDLIRGNVRLVLPERKKVRGVYIHIKGDANTEWSDSESRQLGYGDSRRLVRVSKQYRGYRSYLDWKMFFVGDSSGEMYLEPGQHVYNFSYRLPNDIPSTFEGTHGDVSYEICVVLVIPWWLDRRFTKSFTVIKRMDLNDYVTLHTPTVWKKEHVYFPFCFFCCFPSKPLKILAKIPVGGYIPGEKMKLTLAADNESDRRIPNFKVELIKKITYFADGGEVNSETFCLLRGRTDRGVDTNKKSVIGIEIAIPECDPSDETSGSIIKIKYYLVIKSDSGALFNKPEMRMPIVIGTHPIKRNYFDRPETPAIPVIMPVAIIQPSAPPEHEVINKNEKRMPTVIGTHPIKKDVVDRTETPAIPIIVPISNVQPSAPPKHDASALLSSEQNPAVSKK